MVDEKFGESIISNGYSMHNQAPEGCDLDNYHRLGSWDELKDILDKLPAPIVLTLCEKSSSMSNANEMNL